MFASYVFVLFCELRSTIGTDNFQHKVKKKLMCLIFFIHGKQIVHPNIICYSNTEILEFRWSIQLNILYTYTYYFLYSEGFMGR